MTVTECTPMSCLACVFSSCSDMLNSSRCMSGLVNIHSDSMSLLADEALSPEATKLLQESQGPQGARTMMLTQTANTVCAFSLLASLFSMYS